MKQGHILGLESEQAEYDYYTFRGDNIVGFYSGDVWVKPVSSKEVTKDSKFYFISKDRTFDKSSIKGLLSRDVSITLHEFVEKYNNTNSVTNVDESYFTDDMMKKLNDIALDRIKHFKNIYPELDEKVEIKTFLICKNNNWIKLETKEY